VVGGWDPKEEKLRAAVVVAEELMMESMVVVRNELGAEL